MLKMRALQVLLLSSILGSCAPQEPPFCACVGVESSLEAIERVSLADWADLEPGAMRTIWPEAEPLPCEESSVSGIEAVTESMERCCSSCGTCGGPFFDEADPSELRAVLIVACRESADDVETEMKQLVYAAVPPGITTASEEGWSLEEATDRNLSNGYRWEDGESIFALRARMGEFRGHWLGSFELMRCDVVNGQDRWILEDGSSFEVLEYEIEGTPAQERKLRVSYSSQCVARDFLCLESEWRRLWPRLRSEAERSEVDGIYLTAEGCGGGVSVFPKRASSGDWELPW